MRVALFFAGGERAWTFWEEEEVIGDTTYNQPAAWIANPGRTILLSMHIAFLL